VIYKVYSSISEIATSWDQFLPDGHHLKSLNLRVIEDSKPGDVSFRYLIFYDVNQVPVAVVYFQWLLFQRKHYDSPFAAHWLFGKLEKLVMRKGYHILVCGNLLRIDFPGMYFDTRKATASALFTLLEKFYRELKPYPHAILIKDWNKYHETGWVEKGNYHFWGTDVTMKMDLPSSWTTFDDYVGALRHRYSQRIRKARKQFNPVTRKELSLEEIEARGDELENLYNNVVIKQTIRMMPVRLEYFVQMKRNYGSSFRMFAYYLDERMVAFSSNILYSDLWELHYIGLDYAANERHWLYFNILFDSIADALQAGKKELELGRTARDAKASLGAYPVSFRNYVRVKGFIPQKIVQSLGKYFEKKAGFEWENRKPFKVQENVEAVLNPTFQKRDAIG